ncbi:MAG: hypothetical protein HY859_03975 [Caulobacterales bacterium]|nr:hypothetical protein [Caulobacterales bacterium]
MTKALFAALLAVLLLWSGCNPTGPTSYEQGLLQRGEADFDSDIRVPPGMKVTDRQRLLFPEAVAVDLVVEPDGVKRPPTIAGPARPVADGLNPALPSGALIHRLTPAERNRLNELFYRREVVKWPKDYEASAAACCVPHHEFRYYDRTGREVGRVAICFCCACMNIASAGGAMEQSVAMTWESGETRFRYNAMKTFIRGMGYRTDYYCPERAREP